jgi:carboxypeptidase Taq
MPQSTTRRPALRQARSPKSAASSRASKGSKAPGAKPPHYQRLCDLLRDGALVGSLGALLGWDQETYMPKAGGSFRADQQAFVSALSHTKRTDPRVGELIDQCQRDANLADDPTASANLREMRRDFDLATKLPTELVSELARVGSLAQDAWKQAREESDFKQFRPWLEKMIALTRRKAECLSAGSTGAAGELYDALLDEYEPGMSAAQIEGVFTPLRPRLSALVKSLASEGRAPDTRVLNAKVAPDKQHALGQAVLGAMGFDLDAGRLDTTTHPFCSGLAPGDTRLTTRYRDEKFTDALYGTLHEMGHGLYEQGLPKAASFGQPIADAVSLGIHESQSRLWENFVGRSREFWVWALPLAKKHFGTALAKASVDDLYRAVNTATPSFIRVEADEATYNLHVMLRFALERAMINGDLSIADLPGAWNDAVKDLLGLKVPDDRRGCLQDVHWSFGLIGYFPTYTLGNLYAAQFWEQINSDIPSLRQQMRTGEFGELLAWLRRNIHAHGRRYRADELCRRVTGKALSADPLMRHLEGKLRPIYTSTPGAAKRSRPSKAAR